MSGAEADDVQWLTIMTLPKEARKLLAEQEEAARLVTGRRGPLFEDQNLTL
jgi:hypothetical protein